MALVLAPNRNRALTPIYQMRLAVTLSLMLATTPACAEWVKVGRTDVAVHYVDPASVSRDGNLRRIWALQDLVEDRADGVRSIRALQEHDCADGRFRYLALAIHSGPMAGGELLTEHAMRDAWSRHGVSRSAIGKIVCER